MKGKWCAALALPVLVLAARAEAGEELMAMRGAMPDGATHAVTVAPGRPAPIPEKRVIAPYVGWRATCGQPVVTADGRFERGKASGFAQAPRFVVQPEPSKESFLEMLFREITRE